MKKGEKFAFGQSTGTIEKIVPGKFSFPNGARRTGYLVGFPSGTKHWMEKEDLKHKRR